MAEIAKWIRYVKATDIPYWESQGWVPGVLYRTVSDDIDSFLIEWHHDHDPPETKE